MADKLNKISKASSFCRQQLNALIEVMHVINSSQGLRPALIKVLDLEIELTRAERGFIMLRADNGEFTVEAARSMNQTDLNENDFAVSKTIVHSVAESGKSVLTSDAQEDPRFGGQKSVMLHNLRSIMCAPLELKKEVIGVVFVDSRVHTNLFQESDLEMLSAFANQAAVAIDNARLFDELTTAYEATLEVWASALEMRDKNTKDHTRRVTVLTEILARKMGFSGEELEHIKRGAVLHDIGKIEIPDKILQKPGALTSEERMVMELHPEFAKDQLDKIKFLHPAIDIPYCHHEKWDGSGYPRNLKGEEIPLAARIFAVVDVWDALTSERPYRDPLSPEEVRRFIHENSGTHFDPEVVDTFLEMGELPVQL